MKTAFAPFVLLLALIGCGGSGSQSASSTGIVPQNSVIPKVGTYTGYYVNQAQVRLGTAVIVVSEGNAIQATMTPSSGQPFTINGTIINGAGEINIQGVGVQAGIQDNLYVTNGVCLTDVQNPSSPFTVYASN